MKTRLCAALFVSLTSGIAHAEPAAQRVDEFLKESIVVPASPDAIVKRCDASAGLVGTLRGELEGRAGRATVEGDFASYDALRGIMNDTLSEIYLVSQTHPDKAIRTAAEACVEKLSALDSALNLSRSIYQRLAAIETAGLDEATAFILSDALTDYRLAGVDKDNATRARIEALQNEITQVGLTFDRNIREQKGELVLKSVDDLAGLPADYIATHQPGPDGLIRIGTDYPDVLPIFDFAEKEATRKAMYMVFQNRAWPANEEVLKSLVSKREQLARLLGFPTYAALATKDKMIGSPERAQRFIDEVNAAASAAAQADLNLLLERQKRINPSAERVMPWSSAYLQNLLRKERYDVDSALVRTYFTYDKAKTGVFKLMKDLFGADIRPWNAPVWHESVSAYELYDGSRLIGRFYLDMHPRDGKYSHAAQFDVRTGIDGRRVPVAALVCNFPASGPMDHEDVETFLHEFGHLIHNLYSGHQRYALQSMNGLPRDFVEAPSQLLEEWVWDYDTLKSFATNEAGEPIPGALVKKMNEARRFGEAMRWKTQLGYSAVSLNLYNQPADSIDLTNLWKTQIQTYSTMPYVEGTHPYASFGHLFGYSSVYYTYVWSKAIALDLLTRFKDEGLRNPEVARRYRASVLEPGGSANPDRYIESFLGRPLSIEAFKNSLMAPAN